MAFIFINLNDNNKEITIVGMDIKTNTLLQGIDTVIIRVSDINASKTWYENKLGLTLVWDDSKMKLAVLNTGSLTSLTLWQADKKIIIDKQTASYPIFKTADIAALKQSLQNKDVKVEELVEDEYVKYFFFFDPDGNVLEACQVDV